MTLRIQFAIGVAVAAIVLPILVVQAQSEGDVVPPAAEDSAPAESALTTEPTEPAPAEAAPVEEEAAPTAEQTQTETTAGEGEVLGAEDEDVAAPEAPAATASTTLMTDSASSTATSTPPIEEPKPVEEAAEVRGRRSAPIMGSEPLVDLGRLPELLHGVGPVRERPVWRGGRCEDVIANTGHLLDRAL